MKKAKRKTKSPRTPGTVDEYIGARMRESRLALSMTQESLGELLGVKFQQVQKYERGANRVRLVRDLRSFARITDVDVWAGSEDMIPQINETDYAARLFPDALDFFALVAFGCSVAFTRANVDSDALKISRWAAIQ